MTTRAPLSAGWQRPTSAPWPSGWRWEAFASDSRVRYAVGVIALTALYYGAAHLSFALNFAGPVASIVWLPVGVGIVFLYLAGVEFWPGVLFGELLIGNWSFGTGTSLAQTLANVLEVLVAVIILRRLVRRESPLGTVAGVAGMVFAIAAGVAVSATIGALSLRLGDVVATEALPRVWRTWWLGDFAGALIVVPVGLAWCSWPPIAWQRLGAPEAVLTLAAVAASSAIALVANGPVMYLLFPALILTALRLGQRGATLVVAEAAAVAVWAATHSVGPFHSYSLDRTVLVAQLFIIVASLSTLCLAATVNERNSLSRALRASISRLVETSERERRRLERDLHDGAQQRLVAASIDLSLAGELADGNPELCERLGAASSEVEEALAELREVAHGIYPPALARWGLARAFEPLTARYHGKVKVIEAAAGRFPPGLEAAIYYCCLEAVQNAAKHAGRDARVSIRLSAQADRLHLEVRDDGPGFDTAATHDGVGLQNMCDRLGAVGGRIEITSHPGQGTVVAAMAPFGRPRVAEPPTSSGDDHSTLPRAADSIPNS